MSNPNQEPNSGYLHEEPVVHEAEDIVRAAFLKIERDKRNRGLVLMLAIQEGRWRSEPFFSNCSTKDEAFSLVRREFGVEPNYESPSELLEQYGPKE